jgi:hypothetical protein
MDCEDAFTAGPATNCGHQEDLYAVCGSYVLPNEAHMTGDLTIHNAVEGENGAVTGLLLGWLEGFGWGTLCS